jgi:rhodanese-related sulfurtransferase
MNARDFFTAELAFRTDVSDVRNAGEGIVLVDSRGASAWRQAHIRGALHMPTADIAARAPRELDPTSTIVTYCWGPGCNGATRAALEFAKLGYEVREMIGGIEYWQREGFPVETERGEVTPEPDPFTTVVDTIRCDC